MLVLYYTLLYSCLYSIYLYCMTLHFIIILYYIIVGEVDDQIDVQEQLLKRKVDDD